MRPNFRNFRKLPSDLRKFDGAMIQNGVFAGQAELPKLPEINKLKDLRFACSRGLPRTSEPIRGSEVRGVPLFVRTSDANPRKFDPLAQDQKGQR